MRNKNVFVTPMIMVVLLCVNSIISGENEKMDSVNFIDPVDIMSIPVNTLSVSAAASTTSLPTTISITSTTVTTSSQIASSTTTTTISTKVTTTAPRLITPTKRSSPTSAFTSSITTTTSKVTEKTQSDSHDWELALIIGIPVATAVILLVIGIWYLCWQRIKKRRESKTTEPGKKKLAIAYKPGEPGLEGDDFDKETFQYRGWATPDGENEPLQPPLPEPTLGTDEEIPEIEFQLDEMFSYSVEERKGEEDQSR